MNRTAQAGVREVFSELLVVSSLVLIVVGSAHAAPKAGGDLFAHPYVYLLRGDANFEAHAPNYSYTIPTLDSMFVAETGPLSGKATDTTADSPQCFSITVKRPMALRVIFGESTGTGLAVYEFKLVPIGEYSLGVKKLPVQLRELIAGHRSVNVFFAADLKYQSRFIFDVDASDRILHVTKYQSPKR